MDTEKDTIGDSGIGHRLREERKRLGMTQTELAEVAGVRRLAQAQYESGARVPNARYLAAIAAKGVNLNYLFFAATGDNKPLPPDEQRKIEKQAFDLVEEYVRTKCSGSLSAEGRFVLFEVWRSELLAVASKAASSTQGAAAGGAE